MKVLMANCFHWISFHILERLLTEDHDVLGIDQLDIDKRDFLYTMVGRHANFKLDSSYPDIKKHEFDCMFALVDRTNELNKLIDKNQCTTNQYYLIEESSIKVPKQKLLPNQYFIYLPKLFGPWMNIEDYRRVKNVGQMPIYIDDFTNWLFNLVRTTEKPNIMRLGFRAGEENKDINMSILTKQDNKQCQEEMEKHIKKYQIYYEL